MEKEKQVCLSPRLQLLADLVPQESCIADIGTDHGYLPLWLIQQNKIFSAIACDVREGPLDHARRSAVQYGVKEKLSFRLGNGLSCIQPQEVDTIIIAGMGGETILSILGAAPWVNAPAYRVLLQPMTKAEVLRPWLAEQGYRFVEEHLVYENHTYFPVMVVSGGNTPETLTAGQCWGGVSLLHDPLQGKALEMLLRHLSAALTGLMQSNHPENRAKARTQHALIAQLQQMKEEWHRANDKRN